MHVFACFLLRDTEWTVVNVDEAIGQLLNTHECNGEMCTDKKCNANHIN